MRRGLWLIPLLALSFLVQLPLPVHAASPTFQNIAGGGAVCGASSCSSNVTPGTTGNWEVIGLAWGTTTATTMTVTDTLGDTWVNDAHACASGGIDSPFFCADLWHTVTASTNVVTWTATPSSAAGFFGSFFTWDMKPNPSVFVFQTATASGSTGAPATASTGWTGSQQAIAVTVCGTAGATPCYTHVTAGAGFNLHTGGASNVRFAEDSSTATSPTTFPFTCAGCTSDWVESGVVYSDTAPTTVTAIAPCNFFQLQCWWYPLLFMGLYSGFILMVASRLNTSPRGKAHLFLSALTYGSLIAVIFGIMNIVFPLLMLILNTIIALRLRG